MNVEKSGKFIKKLRNQKKLTQKELAVLLHVTDKAVSKWETGKSMPDFQVMQRLCEILEISIPELLIGENATTTMGAKECVSLVMELADREKVKKAKTLTWYFGIGFLFLMLTIFYEYFILLGFLRHPILDKTQLGLFTILGLIFEIFGFYFNIRNSKRSTFTAKEIETLTTKEKDLHMETAEEMLQFARKSQKAEYKQYKLAFEEISKIMNEDEFAIFSMVGDDYLVNDSPGPCYASLAVTNQRVMIAGEIARGRFLIRYVVDWFDRYEIREVTLVNGRIVLDTSSVQIKIGGSNLESLIEKLAEVIISK